MARTLSKPLPNTSALPGCLVAFLSTKQSSFEGMRAEFQQGATLEKAHPPQDPVWPATLCCNADQTSVKQLTGVSCQDSHVPILCCRCPLNRGNLHVPLYFAPAKMRVSERVRQSSRGAASGPGLWRGPEVLQGCAFLAPRRQSLSGHSAARGSKAL